ncbi:DUF4407 domain-containing protein [Microbispora sp. NEAU-D428]|uniref:DUF4407 domain-containing protein n=1 Tax=Microbispora sitophila TaxID=2771537 RepID=UPI0018691AA8|nr:DUF4407 domain-containing protein [Microbispora sitophila]MBE3012267.1 DUF4407 domain-containing protein [Microbispora sitophila]
MRRFLIALSGARPEVLERCPTEYGKFEGIGGAVLTTAVLAVVSMTFALNSALGVNIVLAVLAALVWGLMILSLDRWLVSTMRADAPRRWPLAVPRVLMALLLGFVISTPLVLQIFRSEIDAQIVQIKQQRADAFAARQQQGNVGKDVGQLRKEVADLEKVISSGGDVPINTEQDPNVKALTAERARQQKLADKHYGEWQCQLYGGPSCPKKGDGPLAQDSRRAYEKDKRRIDLINRQIEDRKRELSANSEEAKQARLASAQDALPKAKAQLDAGIKRQADLQASFDAENMATNGLLIRIQALNEVTGKDTSLGVTRLLLFLLFLLIECLPVTIKLMQRPANYEKVLALAEKHEFRDARGTFSQGMAGPGTSAPPSARSQDVWRIWSRTGETGPQPVVTVPEDGAAYRGPTGTRAETVGETDAYDSLEDEELRRMPDARTTRVPRTGAERPGGVELLPDDD